MNQIAGLLPERPPRVDALFEVRSRRWLVEAVETPAPPASPRVDPACADDDAQSRTLEVWRDFEIDRRILEQEAWSAVGSRGFDPPRHFGAFLHTLRWNCLTATDPNLFQSPFRAGIRIDACQMERRIKEDVREVQGGFPEREVRPVVIDGLPEDAPELVPSCLLDEYRSLREERLKTGTARARAAALLVVGLQQKLLSSSEAFALSLARHRMTVRKQWKRARASEAEVSERDCAVSADRRFASPPSGETR